MSIEINPFTGIPELVGVKVLSRTTTPTTSDYSYPIGTKWIDTVSLHIYEIVDNTKDKAVWTDISASTFGDAQNSVLSIADCTSTPPTEVLGNRYILDETVGTVNAAWDGASKKSIVQFDGVTWIETTPNEGMIIEVEDENLIYVYITSWEKLSAAIPDATTTQKGVVSVDEYDFNITAGALSQRPGSGIYFVGKWGNDSADGLTFSSAMLTVQSAVTAAPANATILVYPGTYTETVTHTANNVTVIGIGKPNSVIITQADANVVNFSTYTGIQYKDITAQCTAATTAINTVQGTSGICAFKECKLSMTSSTDIAASAQPAVGAILDPGAGTAGTLKVILGQVSYKNTGNGGGTALKGAFKVEDGGVINLSLVKGITIENSGTALASSIGIDTSSTGYFVLNENDIAVTDANATIVAGLAYLGGTGVDHEYRRNTVHVTVGATNTGYGLFTADTASVTRSFYNHVHIVGTGGTCKGFIVGTGAELASQFDDVIAANGNNISGTFTQVNSPSDGDLTTSGTVKATTFDTNVAAAAAVTLSGTSLVADGTDANIDINITPKGTGEVNITKVDIDSGAIDGATIATSDITVGAGKTLDVSAGTLTTSAAQKLAMRDYQQVVVVAKSGGDFDTITDAMASITDAATDKRYCILVMPGTYTESITRKEYVDLIAYSKHSAIIQTTTDASVENAASNIYTEGIAYLSTTDIASTYGVVRVGAVLDNLMYNNCRFENSDGDDYLILIPAGSALTDTCFIDCDFRNYAVGSGVVFNYVGGAADVTFDSNRFYSIRIGFALEPTAASTFTFINNYNDSTSYPFKLIAPAGVTVTANLYNEQIINPLATTNSLRVGAAATGTAVVNAYNSAIYSVRKLGSGGTETFNSYGSTVGGVPVSAYEAITSDSAGVVASVSTELTKITTDGDSNEDNVTLAAGTDGQIKIFAIVAVGNIADSVKITPASLLGGTKITFSANALGKGCQMMYDATASGWLVTGSNGGTVT